MREVSLRGLSVIALAAGLSVFATAAIAQQTAPAAPQAGASAPAKPAAQAKLTDRLAVVEPIGATTTKAGLRVESALDTPTYQKGIKVGRAEMNRLDITGDPFHPEWNYTIRPRLPTSAQPAEP